MEKYNIEDYPTRWLRIAAEQNFATDGIALYMMDKPPGGLKRRVVNLMLETVEEPVEGTATWNPPVFLVSFEAAQRLMDDLYRCGVRPKDAGESVGALSATKHHLEDVRKLAEKLLAELLRKE